MPDASSGESDGCELWEAGASMLTVLLIRCDWCSALDTASKPSERLLQRDDPACGDMRERARGEESATLGLDAAGKLPYAEAVEASKPKYDSKLAVLKPGNDVLVAAERSRNDQLNPSIQ